MDFSQKWMLFWMGFYGDQSGILRRYSREKENWDIHLNHTKAFIEANLQRFNTQKCALLGSGFLLDVPMNALLNHFAEIHLFDITHPRKIRKEFAKNPQVLFKNEDISGFIRPVYQVVKQKKRDFLDTILPEFSTDFADYDLVISCNILNQLDIILVDYLSDNLDISEPVLQALREKIQRTHIARLPKEKSLVICDFEEIRQPKNAPETRRKTVFVPIPETAKKWQWIFDTHGRYYPDEQVIFNVAAFNL